MTEVLLIVARGGDRAQKLVPIPEFMNYKVTGYKYSSSTKTREKKLN